ncbi:hypothetical protein PGTUg99_005641 [Puccinia graminis f. sp. tritici]|uniref:Uncharacterized protein n=1 Tax=Puccinia graminis f. sp. tritici TaxID=56615 RepID=A0A5B0NCJ9_PUCGR|nr:hypothetical protein PGTUg99_005641 [Puccinia graminis f. sp. tritici]
MGRTDYVGKPVSDLRLTPTVAPSFFDCTMILLTDMYGAIHQYKRWASSYPEPTPAPDDPRSVLSRRGPVFGTRSVPSAIPRSKMSQLAVPIAKVLGASVFP